MRTFFSIIIYLMILATALGCEKKDVEFDDHGLITGYDLRECACCGGLMINFDDNPQPYGSDFYLINNLPEGVEISEDASFPIPVKVDWHVDENKCSGQFIDITRLKIIAH